MNKDRLIDSSKKLLTIYGSFLNIKISFWNYVEVYFQALKVSRQITSEWQRLKYSNFMVIFITYKRTFLFFAI